MRKKSHILLAQCLADNIEATQMQLHRKAFCLGSILPDIRPSFWTTKHEFGCNFDAVQDKIRELTDDEQVSEMKERVYFRRLGEVSHYVADYFTFPHNEEYDGTLLEHGKYEARLKRRLKEYIVTGDADVMCHEDLHFHKFEDIISYIKSAHKVYCSQRQHLSDDMKFIVSICYQVMQGMLYLVRQALLRGRRYALA